jgi:hypothetical protein
MQIAMTDGASGSRLHPHIDEMQILPPPFTKDCMCQDPGIEIRGTSRVTPTNRATPVA